MNLILFDRCELERPLPRIDRRSVHVLDVLKRQVGDSFDVGLINGPRGKATLEEVTDVSLRLQFAWETNAAPRSPVTVIVGLPRPQTARDILRDATTLGVSSLHFVRTEKSDPNYAQSTLWTSGEWRRHLIAGAEQAFDTLVPSVTHGEKLPSVLATLPPNSVRLALDNYEAVSRLGEADIGHGKHHVLAVGPERGWSGSERECLRWHTFSLVHLGARVLRTETAVLAALSIVRARLDLM